MVHPAAKLITSYIDCLRMLHRHEHCSNVEDAVNSSVWIEIFHSQIMTSIKPVYSV